MTLPVKLATSSALGWSGVEFAVRVDGTTIQINGSNQLEAIGGGGGSSEAHVEIVCFGPDQEVATGDAKAMFVVPSIYDTWLLDDVTATVYTAGTTGTTDVMVRNKTDAVNMLSTAVTIDSAATSASDGTVDASHDDLATDDVIAIDIDAVSTTRPLGLVVTLKLVPP